MATADGETPGIKAEIQELKRNSGGTVTLKLTLINGTGTDLGFSYDFGDPDHHIKDHASVGGISLIDAVNKKKYLVARDSEDTCLCSRGLNGVGAGDRLNVWAKFPAPPDGVQKINVSIPHFRSPGTDDVHDQPLMGLEALHVDARLADGCGLALRVARPARAVERKSSTWFTRSRTSAARCWT